MFTFRAAKIGLILALIGTPSAVLAETAAPGNSVPTVQQCQRDASGKAGIARSDSRSATVAAKMARTASPRRYASLLVVGVDY